MKRALVTGSTDGIGLATALGLAQKNFNIILHGHSSERVERARESIIKKFPKAQLEMVIGDLGSFEQIHILAQKINSNDKKLDVLVNNAGVYMNERELSEDGFEVTFAINHLAPFLLTQLLLDKIKNSTLRRVVNVSSIAHTRGHLDFDNINSEIEFSAYGAYATSKLCNILFSNYLAKLEPSIFSNALHPGVITTKLLKKGFNTSGDTVEKGAATSIYLASDDKLKETGKYFVNCKQQDPSIEAQNIKIAERLWNYSAECCGF